MTVNELIAHLQELADKGNGDLEVFATHGASGACDPVGHPCYRVSDGTEQGEPCEWDYGTPYVDIYIGN